MIVEVMFLVVMDEVEAVDVVSCGDISGGSVSYFGVGVVVGGGGGAGGVSGGVDGGGGCGGDHPQFSGLDCW